MFRSVITSAPLTEQVVLQREEVDLAPAAISPFSRQLPVLLHLPV
jgi:hypothetical protein